MNPQGTAWQKHVRGLANIIQSRGPQGFQSRQSFRVIVLVRLFIVSAPPFHPVLFAKTVQVPKTTQGSNK